MDTSNILTLASLALVIIGGIIGSIWGVAQKLASRDRDSIDGNLSAIEKKHDERLDAIEQKFKESRKIMWQKIDANAESINMLGVDVAKLAGQLNADVARLAGQMGADVAKLTGHIANLPTAESFNKSMAQFEAKIERRLDTLTNLISAAIKKGSDA